MLHRILYMAMTTSALSPGANAQALTLAGGQAFGVASKHDYASVEIELPRKEQIGVTGSWSIDLNNAFSASASHDVHNVFLVSWAPMDNLRAASRLAWYTDVLD